MRQITKLAGKASVSNPQKPAAKVIKPTVKKSAGEESDCEESSTETEVC